LAGKENVELVKNAIAKVAEDMISVNVAGKKLVAMNEGGNWQSKFQATDLFNSQGLMFFDFCASSFVEESQAEDGDESLATVDDKLTNVIDRTRGN
jgi:hypothetical protein